MNFKQPMESKLNTVACAQMFPIGFRGWCTVRFHIHLSFQQSDFQVFLSLERNPEREILGETQRHVDRERDSQRDRKSDRREMDWKSSYRLLQENFQENG